MDAELQLRIERLDKIAPPPRDVLTLGEIADIFEMNVGSLRNMRSQNRLPFQVMEIGGSIRVDKIVFAKYQAGIKDDDKPVPAKPLPRAGRPLNSVGLQRHATQEFLSIIDLKLQSHIVDVSSPIANVVFPQLDKIRM